MAARAYATTISGLLRQRLRKFPSRRRAARARSAAGAGGLQAIQINLRDGFVGDCGGMPRVLRSRGSSSCSCCQSPRLTIDARASSSRPRAFCSAARFELFERRQRGLQLLVLEMNLRPA